MKTACKKTTHIQQHAELLRQTITDVCACTGISREERTMILFEYGCRFAEERIQEPEWQHDMLTQPENGYWAWWMQQFAEDDKMLLLCYRKAGLPPHYSYMDDKEYMLCSDATLERFKHFVSALVKKLEKQL